MDLNDLVPQRRTPTFLLVIRRIGTIVGAILVVFGLLALLLPMTGQGSGSLHEARYLLIAGGVVLLVAQALGRVSA